MSYTIDITKEPVPDDEAQAWTELEELRLAEELNEAGEKPGPHFVPLYEKLVGIYPCITTPEGEDSPWSDGPLQGNFGATHTILGISFSKVETALPVILKTATAMGFTVFDAQDEKIHRPAGWSPAERTPAATVTPKTKPWWKLW